MEWASKILRPSGPSPRTGHDDWPGHVRRCDLDRCPQFHQEQRRETGSRGATDQERLHGDEEEVYADTGYQGITKRAEIAGKTTEVRLVMRPGKCSVLPGTPEEEIQGLMRTSKVAC